MNVYKVCEKSQGTEPFQQVAGCQLRSICHLYNFIELLNNVTLINRSSTQVAGTAKGLCLELNNM